jgi:hypothetical protein
MKDLLGNPLSGVEPATVAAIDDFVEGFLAYETRAERIIEAAGQDEGSCLANAYAGLLWMLLEAPEAAERAGQFLTRAEQLCASATRREQLNVAVLRAWAADDVARAAALCDQATDEFPRDLALLKLHQYFEFNRGNSPQMLRIALKVLPAAQDVPYVHGMAAFAYEQCHLLDEAEHAAQRALALKAKEPWAQHALAHVHLTRGQIEAGAQFLESLAATWVDLNSFMLTHLWWHLALFYISQGRDREALSAYDEHCWGIAKQYSQDQVGAVSLLTRLELAGVAVDGRWADVALHIARRGLDTVQPFLTLQYLYGLARAGHPQAHDLMSHVRDFAARAPAYCRSAWTDVALPAAEGLYAYARGDYDQAFIRLEAAVPRMNEVGGSHAQRDLFDQIRLDAARKGGRLTSAQQQLELRRRSDPHGVPVNVALADVYTRLGLPVLAEAARRRAERTRSRHER